MGIEMNIKFTFYLSQVVIIGIAMVIASGPSMAVENALGRSLPGVWVQPQGGVVPKKPGFSLTVIPVGYTGSLSGGRERRLAPLLANSCSTLQQL
jgi:hypothetical protein